MRILVTGGAGFIGTNLITRLLKEGHEVTSIDDYSTGRKENHISGCVYHTENIENIKQISFSSSFDLIYHIAGLSRIQPSFNDPQSTFQANTAGTQSICEFARLQNAKVIYAGSSSKWHNPYQSPYATYKYLGEEICKMYRATYGMNIEIARFYNVYGPYEVVDGDFAAVIGIWRRQVRDGEKITIVGDGEQRRDFTHVDDICNALWRIGMKNIKHEDAWELGTGMNYSINDVYLMFERKFGVESVNILDQKGNYRETLRENDDSLDRLGWKPLNQLATYIANLN
jgi:UDP-glucose 4-epimerase|tara:strand:+ start:3473 stop:4327 length:855 start_codon:yes stop_codon:yes gene_type:complete